MQNKDVSGEATPDPNDELRRLMTRHHLRRIDVAELSGYTKSSVDRWLCPRDHPRFLAVPDRGMRLLRASLLLSGRT